MEKSFSEMQGARINLDSPFYLELWVTLTFYIVLTLKFEQIILTTTGK